MPAPRLSAQVSSFRYPDGTTALSDILLDVMPGEFCGILGSNGSGKTTLLKLLDGMIKDFNGTILLDGDDICRLSPRQIYSKVGLVFQNPDDQLFAHSVYEDVAFGPRNMGLDEDEVRRRVAEALEAVEMAELAAKDIHNLSYGQKKRACIAGLLAMGHEILLLDEPTAGLDPMGEYRMMELLTRLNGRYHYHGHSQRRSGAGFFESPAYPQPGPSGPQRNTRRGVQQPRRPGRRKTAPALHCRVDPSIEDR
jgi:cobalt/nickel transport system ATP-binding protein